MTIVLSPCPPVAKADEGPGPAAGRIRGKRIGLRRDRFWRSWDWITDEWNGALQGTGACPVIWRAPVGKGAEQARAGTAQLAGFLSQVDIVITGLCTCGSCTLWAVHDGLEALKLGIPAVFVSTTHFERLARALAARAGFADIRMHVLPHPMEGRLEEDVRHIAREHFGGVLAALGAEW